jgi:hypothetical protein
VSSWRIVVAIAIAGCHRGPVPAPALIGNQPTGSGSSHAGAAVSAASVQALLEHRFARQLADHTFVSDWNGTEADVLTELAAMGWYSVEEIARAIPRDFDQRGASKFTLEEPANIPVLLRNVMIVSDAKRYFGSAWDNHWSGLAPGDRDVYDAYHLDLEPMRTAGVLDQ